MRVITLFEGMSCEPPFDVKTAISFDDRKPLFEAPEGMGVRLCALKGDRIRRFQLTFVPEPVSRAHCGKFCPGTPNGMKCPHFDFFQVS